MAVGRPGKDRVAAHGRLRFALDYHGYHYMVPMPAVVHWRIVNDDL
jgi:hypothetical protein